MDPQPQTPGWKTSELWLTCGAQISAFVVAMGTNDMTAKIVTGVIAGVSIAGYLWMRYQLKKANPSMPIIPPTDPAPATTITK